MNVCGGDVAPTVTSTTPANSATNVALAADISVTFSEAVTVSGAWYTISCANSGTHTATVSGGPTTFTLNPDINFTGGELCTVTIESTLVADQDGTADNMTADYTFSFTTTTPPAVCGDPATPIHDVQGNGAASPDDGVVRTIEGIVVGDFQDYTTDPPNEISGYFLQEEDAQVDADPNTSEGIFVFDGQNPATNVALGDKVRVVGTVDEFNNLTELTSVSNTQVCSSGNTLPTAASITLPVTALTDYEKFEGMRVTFPQELTVTDTFTLGRFGEILLSEGGRLPSPTDAAEPGAPAQAVRAANILRSIFLDDGLTNQNPDPLIHPAPGLSASNTLRGGDTTTGLTGVLYYLGTTSDYRIMPSEAITWNHENPRPTDAPVISGTLQIVGSNTLNYFITLDNPNTTADNICGPANNQECRGANTTQEFTRQRDKFLNALAEMDADVFGLMELENNSAANPAGDDNDPVLEDIVNGLNDLVGAGTYDFIDTGTLGGDAIKVGLIYKVATVTPVGDYAVLDSSVDPLFDTSRNRPALAQTFEEIATGGQLTVVVNHFKSKGSGCGAGDDVADTSGGNCNGTRTDAATALVNWLATDPTGSGDPDFLVIGDLNSYAKEDPIDVFINAGYVDLADEYNTDPYSYSFDGEWGYLDYALANPSLATQVTDAKEWHVNADEPPILDYNTEFKSPGQISSFYSPDPFRWSDHDPIIVGFDLDVPDTTAPTVTINQASGQTDPTSTSPINFTVVFSEPVTGFATGDVTLSGTAGATTAVVTQIAPNDGTTYNVAVSGMT
ncbi:MAG TPA: ExeM/NucH family extracellular endonuclease, partial [Promineifilum sp.]|nr:ExeM/NucH family extracellular endonuclease [Promineifilum sp.]